VLHVGAILYYRLKKGENLVRPMVGGDKEVALPAASSRDDAFTRAGAGVVLVACAALVWWVVRLGAA
jgi:hypothetical protein